MPIQASLGPTRNIHSSFVQRPAPLNPAPATTLVSGRKNQIPFSSARVPLIPRVTMRFHRKISCSVTLPSSNSCARLPSGSPMPLRPQIVDQLKTLARHNGTLFRQAGLFTR